MSHSSNSTGQISHYRYDPSLPTAIVGAVLFSLVGILTIFQYIRTRSWYFWPMVLGACMEMCGFIARAPSAHSPDSRDVFIVSFVMIILAPAVMAAACYQTFGRLIFYVTPESKRSLRTLWLPARFITPIFVGFDVVSFLIQLIGATIVSAADVTDSNKIKKGSNIVKVGLAVQLVCFGFFSFVGVRFIFISRSWRQNWPNHTWTRLNYAVNVVCALILIRSIYRMVEFAEDHRTGYVNTHEWTFWVFDALPMLFALITFVVIHPGYYLPNRGFKKTEFKGSAPLELQQPRNENMMMEDGQHAV